MRLSHTLLIQALCLCLSTPFAYAQTQYQQLEKLIDAQNYEAAFQHAEAMAGLHEGNPEFDLSYAIAAIETGHLESGVFALERILLVEPYNFRAKLELARAYYIQSRYDMSRTLFLEIQKQQPPHSVNVRIEFFLAQIAANTNLPETRFSHFLEFKSGYDNNINTGPSTQPGLVILSDDALGRGDHYNQYTLGSRVDHIYSKNKSLFFSLNADMRGYSDEVEQDYLSLNLSGGHRWSLDDQQFQLSFFMQKYDLDHQDYRSLIGASGSWTVELNDRLIFRTYTNFGLSSYNTSEYRDANQYTVGGSLFYASDLPWKPLFFGGIYGAREKPNTPSVLANAEVDSRATGANIGIQVTPHEQLKLTLSGLYQDKEYLGEDFIYNVRREDSFSSLNLNMEWEFTKDWQLLAGYQKQSNNSNIELQEYKRDLGYFGIRYNF